MVSAFSTAKIVSGRGSLAEIGKLAGTMGKRALVVTSRGGSLRRAGVIDRVEGYLAEAGLVCGLFEGVEPEPGLPTVEEGLRLCLEGRYDVVVAIGGGSAIDVGKAVAGLAGTGIDLREAFLRGKAVDGRSLPCIAVPTTSGTGAEVTFNSVLTDRDTDSKLSIRGQALLPAIALLDPELTTSMPPSLTAHTGMDALTQALESYVSRGASPITDALALDAARLVGANLERAYHDGLDIEAREAVAYGSLMAGMALANARLGAVHGMAHSIGSRCRMAHGLVCAVLLPYVLRFNEDAAALKHRRAEEAMGLARGTLADFVLRLNSAMCIPDRLGLLGLREDMVEGIVAESLPSGSLKANPKTVTADDIRAILTANLD